MQRKYLAMITNDLFDELPNIFDKHLYLSDKITHAVRQVHTISLILVLHHRRKWHFLVKEYTQEQNDKTKMHTFTAVLDLIGINPFVSVPEPFLKSIFEAAGKNKGPIPVKGTINQEPYIQTLVRYRGEWRLYINTTMLAGSPQRIGEKLQISIIVNTAGQHNIKAPVAFLQALKKDKEANGVYKQLAPYLRKEINRYLSGLKTTESLNRNILRALNFLKGRERFIGRDKP